MHRSLRLATALLALAGSASAFAQSMGSSGDTLYRRYIAGDPSIDRMPTTGAPAQVPGPNAQHLIYLGVDARVAIAQARTQGEQPQTPAAAPSTAPLVNGYDLYARNAMAAAPMQSLRQGMR